MCIGPGADIWRTVSLLHVNTTSTPHRHVASSLPARPLCYYVPDEPPLHLLSTHTSAGALVHHSSTHPLAISLPHGLALPPWPWSTSPGISMPTRVPSDLALSPVSAVCGALAHPQCAPSLACCHCCHMHMHAYHVILLPFLGLLSKSLLGTYLLPHIMSFIWFHAGHCCHTMCLLVYALMCYSHGSDSYSV